MYLRRAAAAPRPAARADRCSSPTCSGCSRGFLRHPSLLPARAGGASLSFPSFSASSTATRQVREVRDDVSRTFAALEQAQTALQARRHPDAERDAERRRALEQRAGRRDRRRGATTRRRRRFRPLERPGAARSAIVLALHAARSMPSLLPGLVRRRRALRAGASRPRRSRTRMPPASARERHRRGSDARAAHARSPTRSSGSTSRRASTSPSGR